MKHKKVNRRLASKVGNLAKCEKALKLDNFISLDGWIHVQVEASLGEEGNSQGSNRKQIPL
jgi:hypothetical protein